MNLRHLLLVLVTCLWVGSAQSAQAQSMNIDFGTAATSPGPNFAAAGEAGNWNSISGDQGVSFSLFGLDGAPTGVSVVNIGGSQILTDNHPDTQGNFERLLDDYLVTFNANLEVCLFFNGLEDGQYQVITYAWLPLTGDSSLVSVDESTEPNELIGGSWSGAFEEGVTHAIHLAEVVNGSLGLHSGVPIGGTPIKAALNGVQLIKIPDPIEFRRGDVNADASLDIGDMVALLGILFQGQSLDCADAIDVNDDGQGDIADAVFGLAHLFSNGPAPAAPFGQCGVDPTVDGLDCAVSPSC